MIRSSFLALCIIIGSTLSANAQSPSDVLFTVDGHPVTVSEFSYIYEKNNGSGADYSKASLDEYLDLYIKFKLKVRRALDTQMDTIPELKSELLNYQKQLASSYLMDKEVLNKLLKEFYDRQKEDVQIAHILFPKQRSASGDGMQEAKLKAEEVQKDIQSGKITFEAAAKQYSGDQNTSGKGGVLNYMTAMLPPNFEALEDAMYTLPKGKLSDPIPTKLGYHLIKVIDKRPARGTLDISHILIRTDKDKQPVPDAEERAMAAYNQLLLGKSWDDVVEEYSEDLESRSKKGALGKVSIGMLAPEFEDAAFGIQKDGDFTMPVLTKSGYHIIKRNTKEDLGSFDLFKRRHEKAMEQRPRYAEAKESLIESIKAENKYKVNESVLTSFIKTIGPDFYTFKWRRDEVDDATLFTFNDTDVYTLEDFVNYLKDNVKARQRFSQTTPADVSVREMLDSFSDDEAILYEEKNLEVKYEDFKNLMREYREGILLFETSKVNVWDKASQDSSGLAAFYEQNRDAYKFAPVAKVINYVVKSTDGEEIKDVLKHAKKNDSEKTLDKFNKKDAFFVKVFEGEVSQDKNMLKNLEWKVGGMSDIEINGEEGKATFSKIVEIQPAKPKSLSEARGYVIADYQDYLEQQWVEELRAAYEVKINDGILKKLRK